LVSIDSRSSSSPIFSSEAFGAFVGSFRPAICRSRQTPSAAGSYSFAYPGYVGGHHDIEFTLTVQPNPVWTDGGKIVSYTGRFSELLAGEYASVWAFSDIGGGPADDLSGMVGAVSIDSEFGALGYGDSDVAFAFYAVPEPGRAAMLLSGLSVIGCAARRERRRT